MAAVRRGPDYGYTLKPGSSGLRIQLDKQIDSAPPPPPPPPPPQPSNTTVRGLLRNGSFTKTILEFLEYTKVRYVKEEALKRT